MNNLYSLNNIRNLLKKYNFNFSKGLGQNFICDPHICPKMVEKSGINQDSGVIEIGPGIGVLTREIASHAKKVIAIEIDKRLFPILNETTSDYNNIKFINDDILKIDINEIINNELLDCSHLQVCANLPYYITSQVIMKILEEENRLNSIVVMVQKEAARRICAIPGSRECGALSVAIRYYGTPQILFNVSKNCFVPIPKVDSSVIKININHINSKKILDKLIFFKIIKSAFAQRRKTIINSLYAGLSFDKDQILCIINKLGISEKCRAEDLSFEEFVYLSNEFYKIIPL